MRILQREIRGGNRHFAQIDATTRIAAKVFVVIRKNTLHYQRIKGGGSMKEVLDYINVNSD